HCHSPDNKIYLISGDGARVEVIASLPETARADGALTFDRVGKFGFRLLAATGRSPTSKGGSLYAVDASGTVRRVGSYPGPGGAENVIVAPAGFGALGGQALLAVDDGQHGSLLGRDRQGRAGTIARLP